MTDITLDHIHLRGTDPEMMAKFFVDHFGFKIHGRQQARGLPRVAMRLGSLSVFIEGVPEDTPRVPKMPFRGIEHICLRVSDLGTFVNELVRKGVNLTGALTEIRPGVRIAFVEAPEGVSIELIERTKE